MTAETFTKRFFRCPRCGDGEFTFEHLIGEKPRTFSHWGCRNVKCQANIGGTVHPDGTVEVEAEDPDRVQSFVLLRAGDLFMVIDGWGAKEDPLDGADYYYHSHTCTSNVMRSCQCVFTKEEADPHGVFRVVGVVVSTPELADPNKLSNMSPEEILALFKTDGEPLPSEW